MKLVGMAAACVVVLAGAGAFLANGLLSNAFAAIPDAPEIGQPMPAFELKDAEGNTHTSEMYKDKIVLLNFSSQQCPFSRGADAAINALAKEYQEKGVVFLGIDSHKSTTPEEIKMHAEKAKVPYPILKDPGNKYADAAGARVTPELFIVNKGVLAYHGPPDNRMGPESDASEHYAADALAALVAGEEVKVTSKSAWGCGIKRAS